MEIKGNNLEKAQWKIKENGNYISMYHFYQAKF